MKWIQDEWNRGKAFDVVRCFTSAVLIFPITFEALSTTAMLVSDSLLISCSASARVLSPLNNVKPVLDPESCNLLDRYSLNSTNAQISQDNRVQLIKRREAVCIFPQEFDELQLTQDTHNLLGAIFADEYAVYPAPKDFYGL